jgi:hypothetical protein
MEYKKIDYMFSSKKNCDFTHDSSTDCLEIAHTQTNYFGDTPCEDCENKQNSKHKGIISRFIYNVNY